MDKKRLFSVCICLLMLLSMAPAALAAEERTEPLPAEPDTTLGDVQQHFDPEVYEEMPEELRAEADATRMEDLDRKSISVNKVFGGFALASVVFLTYACATDKGRKPSQKKQKQK